jgi:hypothetical protein
MLNFRRANLNDIDILIELRKKQLVDEGLEPKIDIDKELYTNKNGKKAYIDLLALTYMRKKNLDL